MLFNSLAFCVFLPIVFLLYWFVFRQIKAQNAFLVAASYLFYSWWDWRCLGLIILTSLLSYWSGILIERFQGKNHWQRWVTVSNIIANLSILCTFKYYDFFSQNLQALLQSFNLQANWQTLGLILPVGISFYTFQALSYSIDVYRGQIKACRDLCAFFAYISFFPQLVAGPIERATHLLPQFYAPRQFKYDEAVDGCRILLWGFFKKMVVADNCAEAVNLIWSNYSEQSAFTLLIGGVLFTFQIYGDFSGYSDIAIGTARLFGIRLMRNFHYPYFAKDIAEFWRKWHISLTSWFRDYIYFPLGGSRCSRLKAIRNTLIIFLLSGLWHGANWTFIVWGAYHAMLFIPLLYLRKDRKSVPTTTNDRLLPSFHELGQMILTFSLVVIGWIIFRSQTVSEAMDYLCRLVDPSLVDFSLHHGKKALLLSLLMLLAEWLQRNKAHVLQDLETWLKPRPLRFAFYYLSILLILYLSGKQEVFVYFQF